MHLIGIDSRPLSDYCKDISQSDLHGFRDAFFHLAVIVVQSSPDLPFMGETSAESGQEDKFIKVLAAKELMLPS